MIVTLTFRLLDLLALNLDDIFFVVLYCNFRSIAFLVLLGCLVRQPKT